MNCEQSIQNQFHDLLHEVTVVDDGLTDRADALIQKYWDVMDRYGLTDPEDTPFIAEGSGCTIFCAEGKAMVVEPVSPPNALPDTAAIISSSIDLPIA